jgi:hypothetical protein
MPDLPFPRFGRGLLLVVTAAQPLAAQVASAPEPGDSVMAGVFYNAGVQAGGSVSWKWAVREGYVSGYINFTSRPEDPNTLCGAGVDNGTRLKGQVVATVVSEDPDPGCGFDRGAKFSLLLNGDSSHLFGYYGIANDGASRITAGNQVNPFELWPPGQLPARTGFEGILIDSAGTQVGLVTMSLVLGRVTVSGTIDLTNLEGRPPICGAGELAGRLKDDVIEFSLVSLDADPGCAGELSQRILLRGRLADQGRKFTGQYPGGRFEAKAVSGD